MIVPMRHAFLSLQVAALILLSGCSPKPAEQTSSAAWNSYVSAFLESAFAANPDLAVYQGRHEFDGKLPDWSPAAIKQEIDRLRAERAKAVAFDAAKLDTHQRFERLCRRRHRWPSVLAGIRRGPSGILSITPAHSIPMCTVSREYAPLEQRLKAYTAYARAVPAAMKQIRENLRTPCRNPT
jgi:hypothetical protein